MKTVFIYLFVFLFSVPNLAQVSSNCSNYTTQFYTEYKHDINYLTMRRLYEIKHPDTTKIKIPTIHIDSIMSAFVGVYNLGTSLEADSVYAHHCIHDYAAKTNSITAQVDTNYAYIKPWKTLQTQTNHPPLDYLMNQYGFVVTDFHSYTFGNFVTIQSNQLLNLKAFADSLDLITGIAAPYPNGPVGDGDRIRYSANGSIKTLKFSLRWGDCPSGCISSKTWSYTINTGCLISYQTNLTASLSEPQPAPKGCQVQAIATLQMPCISLYPNPAHDHITLKTTEKYKTYRILSSAGLIIITLPYTTNELNISSLPPGFYILELCDDKGYRSYGKIVKE